jgi:rSAM/selenodomain-associated transferase 1
MEALIEQLIIFSRYPEPGRTKTRLIPRLGAAGAAELQRQMTEHTLRQVRTFQTGRSVLGVVAFTGATADPMRAWLGAHWQYAPQAVGDLGQRMAAAIATSQAAGAQRTVIIGIDCPDLTPAILTAAFEQLQSYPVVLGPAQDGGYYLVGVTEPMPALFTGIDWGTDRVLAQSLQAIAAQGKSCALLPTLGDVDYPEDLPIWEKYAQP